jgi:copper chaperone
MHHLVAPDISCEGCGRAITATVRRVDPGAEVRADLAMHAVAIRSTAAAALLAKAIGDAGFTVEAEGQRRLPMAVE